MENAKEQLERMANEWITRGNGAGVDVVNTNDESECDTQEQAYILGRYDQVLSVMEALEIDSDLLDTF